jgi:hypothetical protein
MSLEQGKRRGVEGKEIDTRAKGNVGQGRERGRRDTQRYAPVFPDAALMLYSFTGPLMVTSFLGARIFVLKALPLV